MMGDVLLFPAPRSEIERLFSEAIAPLELDSPLRARLVATVRDLGAALNRVTTSIEIPWPSGLAGLTDAEHEAVVALIRQAATDSARAICEQVMIETLRGVASSKTSS